MSKSVLIVYTGGTIGMRKTEAGYAPEPGYLQHYISQMPQLNDTELPKWEILEFSPLLDSANISPKHWNQIAEAISRNIDKYDGFVVLHGTDTMAYSASALSFMLSGLKKPVILTGSQIPLSETRNDARENLLTSLILATHEDIREVCLYFNGKLFRGNRSSKVHSTALEAFSSPNYPPLADIGIEIAVHGDILLPRSDHPFKVQQLQKASVGTLRFYPGISSGVVRNVLRPPLQGLVLECYGAGNMPDQNPKLLNTIAEACERGVIIVATTQCRQGGVSLRSYASGSALRTAGVVGGRDMTVEAALTKLLFLLSSETDPNKIKNLLQEDLCGELTFR